MDDSKIDEMIAEVSREWATGKWSSIVISIGEPGNPSLGFIPCATWRINALDVALPNNLFERFPCLAVFYPRAANRALSVGSGQVSHLRTFEAETVILLILMLKSISNAFPLR